jgi:hypothetical protein
MTQEIIRNLPGFESNGVRILALDEPLLKLFLKNKKLFLEKIGLPPQHIRDTAEMIEISKQSCLPNMKKSPDRWFFYGRWVAIDIETQRIVAEFNLKNGIDSTGATEIGYAVYPSFQKQGWMTKTMTCFLAWAGRDRQLKRIKVEIEKKNKASARVVEKCGFRKFAEMPDTIWWIKNV